MELLAMLAGLFGTIAPIALVGWWILGPIDRAARLRQAPVRFSIGDFMCLFVAVQIPFAAIYYFFGSEQRGLVVLLTVITWIAAPVIWFACARSLSKAGVMTSRHRFMFMGVILPFVYYGLPLFVLSTAITIIEYSYRDPFANSWSKVWIAPVWLVLAAGFYLSGLYSRRILRSAWATDKGASMSDA